jgi:hypothetical protein
MSQESEDRLVNFIHESFGARCAELLLVGLGEEPRQGSKKLYVPEAEEGTEWEVEIEVVGGALPCRSEPLVLAALLKLLLGRKDILSSLEFHMSEVTNELRQAGVLLTDKDVDRIVSKYVALSYDKRAKDANESNECGGVYSLVTGYFRDSVKGAGETSSTRTSSSIRFDQSFIEGLRKGEVVVAGIGLGKLGEPTR